MTLVDTTTPEELMACRARARVERRMALIDATITLIAEYGPSSTVMARVSVPSRCTQNPTMGEERRKGRHPDRIAARGSDTQVLVMRAGPSGLEAARLLGQRGYRVALTEAGRVLGGLVVHEAALPGTRDYIRGRDWREGQIARMPNVEVLRESLTAEDICDFGADHVVIATGARWRRDLFTGRRFDPIAEDGTPVFTPDDIMDGRLPVGPVVVHDADGYDMGGVIAEKLRTAGLEVTLVTPDKRVSAWAENTGEDWRVPGHLMHVSSPSRAIIFIDQPWS
jgi:dimethylamine/trimethylamine dehydrogenase